MSDGWEAFAEAATTFEGGYAIGVASYVHSDFHPAISLTADHLVGTVRRRQDQLR
jgi:hypothetical protein